MKSLAPNENCIEGKWIFDGKDIVGDEGCSRIEFLIKSALHKIADGNWETLFQDPNDGRYWERTYPQGHMHGGGPPMLRVISAEEAKLKYMIK